MEARLSEISPSDMKLQLLIDLHPEAALSTVESGTRSRSRLLVLSKPTIYSSFALVPYNVYKV